MELMIRLIQISLVIMCATISIWAQSHDELKAKYGAPRETYEIRPGIMMTVKFDANQQVSEMRVYSSTTISPNMSKEIVNELAPVAARGSKTDFPGFTVIVGGSGTAIDDYENVSITYSTIQTKECSGLVAIEIKWKKRAENQR